MAWRAAIGLALLLASPLSLAEETLFQPDDGFARFYRDLSQAIEKQDRSAVMKLVADDFAYERDPDGIFNRKQSGKDNFSRVFLPAEIPEEFKKSIWANLQKTVDPHLLFKTSWGVCPAPLPSLEDISKNTSMHYLASIRDEKVRLRSAPSLNSSILHEVSNGDVMVIGSTRGSKIKMSPRANILTSAPDLWLKVVYKDFPEAYVHSSLVTFWEIPRFCFAKEGGEWRLASFVNGAKPKDK
ncbi:SH3 domain-containing protein [Pokkaliibacter sp. CJK22405]|uniref:SH3 domain-containing protein n=1 Tax=Pokkaliibacter sp. CJK22405 TaxID=3384615 RepID=UPI00398483C0